MHSHVASCLRGPVSARRVWWGPVAPEKTPAGPNQASCRENTMDNRTEPFPPRDPEIRADLVARVRREIAAGTYETEEKWEIALGRLLERLEEQ